ncbi:hypothetical protein SSX86_022062 [Deinandra increscens subsp. villosa]|uniref:RING-CH-type domain-containing protein n=1 Tax=Deinandra increscens subsp. villosa TaxID=3103831 RepID=A0AAP0CN50_9ASTR
MGEVRLCFVDFNDDDDEYLLYPSAAAAAAAEVVFCRICHETEFESSSKTMESPCYCSGTVKFAHRDCIQRWCDEKGNTTCEICLQVCLSNYILHMKRKETYTMLTENDTVFVMLQEFQPGYSSPPLQPIQNHGVVVVVSLEVHETEIEVNSATVAQQERIFETPDTSASVCRFFGLAITVLLLVRHLFVMLVEGTGGDYPFTLLTLLVMRASGILVPMYIIMHMVDAIHKTIKSRFQVSEDGSQRQQYV